MPPGQGDAAASAAEDGLLGECHPAKGTRLTLRAWGGKVILWRHRNKRNSGPDADPAAYVTCAAGVVTAIKWDDWHQRHQPVWMASVEDWVRETLEAES
jgi:hypothetical protein